MKLQGYPWNIRHFHNSIIVEIQQLEIIKCHFIAILNPFNNHVFQFKCDKTKWDQP